MIQRVAQEGLRHVAAGWTWKFDPNALRRFRDQAVHDRLADVVCPVGYIYGERSEFGGVRSARYLEQILGRSVPIQVVGGSYHHVPLDAPTECATAIDELVSAFGSSTSRTRTTAV
jgi:pimeloyl-ACP methyl ester carboxylesterase